MDYTEGTRCRVVGDYILGRRIGSGSFSVVWQARHRQWGIEVAIKEIDKKQLNSKMNESLSKEITILRQIRHQNIIRLHDAMEIGDRLYLVLEYCPGSDLAAYIQRFGRVSVAIARHFMRQLASGLQVLRENNLIHRDLKPQNLLLSSKEEAPILKIGDFGFARYLMPQGLAETLCGSPLYMAPEIIQSQKYDAKADLWSVGAILFQLVTGKPPFEGNSQLQLFQNILASKELQFPQDVKGELPMDCIDLCKSLLRQNPVERLSFEEFFNHKFMVEPRPTVGTSFNSPLQGSIALIEKGKGLTDDESFVTSDKGTQLNSGESILSLKKPLLRKDHDSEASSSMAKESTPEYRLTATSNSLRKSIDGGSSNLIDQESMKMESADRGLSSMSMLKVADSLEHIERDYVLVHFNSTSMETLSSSLEASVQDTSATRHSDCPKTTGKDIVAPVQMRELAVSSVCGVESLGSHGSAPLVSSQASAEIVDVQRSASLHPSTRLRFLCQYVHALSELAREKLNAGLRLESFSVELVALAVWREALLVCSSWVASSAGGDSVSSSASECPPGHESSSPSLNMVEGVDFNSPASVCAWAKKGFIVACNRAESNFFHNMDGSVEMPDAMEIIYQAALAAGRDGAVDQLMGECSRAAASYKKARLLLSFILEEATLLPLNPPFSLSASDQQRIHRYIDSLKAHQSQSEMMLPTF